MHGRHWIRGPKPPKNAALLLCCLPDTSGEVPLAFVQQPRWFVPFDLACSTNGRTACNALRCALLVKSTALHDPRSLELSVEPHVLHLCALSCIRIAIVSAGPSGSMEELCAGEAGH
jgi:hypothetical protein